MESDKNASRLANLLTNNLNKANSKLNNPEAQIGLLAADSYEKAAFAAYVLGRFSDAVKYQSNVLKFIDATQNRFLLAKYQVRNGKISEGVKNLNRCIDDEPVFAVASFKEIDLINEPEVINLISNKNRKIDSDISKLIENWKKVESLEASSVLEELTELSQKSYEIKVSQFNLLKNKAKGINKNINALESTIDSYISEVRETVFCTFDSNAVQLIIDELLKAKDLPLETMQEEFEIIKNKVEGDTLKIGSTYAGGIVFYIDKSGKHGLVCAGKDFGKAIWGTFGEIGANEIGVSNGYGMRNTIKIVQNSSWIRKGFLSLKKTPTTTAARLCLESKYKGYSDWFLPTVNELDLIYNNLHKKKIGGFKKDCYWSSSETGINDASYCDFEVGGVRSNDLKLEGLIYGWNKNKEHRVRAVRAF